MQQTAEAQAFLAGIAQLPPGPGVTDQLSKVLQPSLEDEAQLRQLWATNKGHVRLRDPHVGLVDVFDAPDDIRKTRARIIKDDTDLAAQYLLPLDETRRRKDGEPSMVSTLEDFRKNWALFTEGSLSQLLDWKNVIAAGGSVQACLMPVPESANASKRALRKYFHNNAFPTSDVDLFLYGMTPEQAEVKMQAIFEAVRDSVPWDVTCVRTKHTVSIHSQYPYRSVQIVLRLYSSPAEILAGFDVDAPCCAFDGERVWANPRAIVAMMRQCNTVDMTRRSPSYEVRLTKYALRDFEVFVPNLRRDDIDPTIFERSIQRIQGLARLLVLERMIDAETRQRYLVDRRKLRARPDADIDYSRRKKKLKGDLKANIDIGGLEMNDYDVQSLHIPYGPGWDARRIDKLVYQTDLGMNSPYNPKNKDRRFHRHPAFFGTLVECLEDCCEYCPEPKDDEEKELQKHEDGTYVRGRVQFIQEDPGRQSMSGSFNPIDEGEWAEQAYMGPTEKFFNAIVSGDRAIVSATICKEGFDIDRRDHVGRTPLQIAILSREVDIACDLIEAGAHMTSRLVDGRTALHLAAQLDLPVVVRRLLQRSAVNDEKAKEEEAAKLRKKSDDKMDVDANELSKDKDEEDDNEEDEDRDSSDDDWSSDDGDKRAKDKEQKQDLGQIPEDEKDVPDVFDIDVPDWDYMLTPLQYAVIFGSLGAIDELLAGGADAKLFTQRDGWHAKPMHPLTLTSLTRDVDIAVEIVKKLVAGGATSSQADDDVFTIFHKIVCDGKSALVEGFLTHDPNAKAVLNSPHVLHNSLMTFPVLSAIGKDNLATLATLLAFGAKVSFTEEDVSHALDLRKTRGNGWQPQDQKWQHMVNWPVEHAIGRFSDAIDLLLDVGADYNIGVRVAYSSQSDVKTKMSILDAVRGILVIAKQDVEELRVEQGKHSDKDKYLELVAMDGWKAELGKRLVNILEESERGTIIDTTSGMTIRKLLRPDPNVETSRQRNLQLSIEYYTRVEDLLLSHGAKTWKELYPDESAPDDPSKYFRSSVYKPWCQRPTLSFYRMGGTWAFHAVPSHLVEPYETLFHACCTGDNAKIEDLCLPKNGRPEKPLLQIASRFGEDWGTTPLALAIENRHWSTARLVLAISVAQYKLLDAKPPKFRVGNITLDHDSGSEESSDEDDDMSDDDDEPPQINFIDIAQRPSAVQTDAPPDRMLQLLHRYQDPKTKSAALGPVLFKAVIDDDFEAFVQIADLYKSLPKPLDLPPVAIQWILSYDRSTMLDEFIRRTGAGIDVLEESQDEEEKVELTDKPKKLPPKTYYGLNVHGKKRADLARKVDPNAPQTDVQQELPLLWKAAHEPAIGCVRYLSTEPAMNAYQYYSSTHSNDRARYLKRIENQLPQRLGWSVDHLNESVVTASVIGGDIGVLKSVIDLQPAQLQSAIMARIHYVGFNHILVSANWGCSLDIFDYLLSKGVSPTETDARGWNALHILCVNNTEKHMQLMEHILQKLPKDTLDRMLMQQSKKAMNTPLHLAVKRRSIMAVRLLLQAKVSTFLTRDQNGSTALHIAVQESLAEITRLLAEAGPSETLNLEDGVGNTPLEIAIYKWLDSATGRKFNGTIPPFQNVHEDLRHLMNSRHHTSMKEVEDLKNAIDRLHTHGRLREGTKLSNDLASFTQKLETVVKRREDASTTEDAHEDPDAELKVLSERGDTAKTLEYLIEALSSSPGLRRHLVHLIDVHHSVAGSLDRSKRGLDNNTRNNFNNRKQDDEGLDPEIREDDEEKMKGQSAIAKWHSHYTYDLFDIDRF